MLMRPRQWVKNLFVLAPVFFSGHIMDGSATVSGLTAFVVFCFAASSIYCLNDMVDAPKDRLHPTKQSRPIASGSISQGKTAVLMLSLALLSIVTAWLLSGWSLVAVTALYIGVNTLYSLGLKRFAILDVSIVAAGFLLRLEAGGVATGVTLSHWIVIITFLLALLLAFGKRRDDLVILQRTGNATRDSLRGYNMTFLNVALGLLAAAIIIGYFLYTISPEVVAAAGSGNLYWTGMFVVVGVLRYLHIAIVNDNAGSPTKILFSDVPLQLCIAGWLLTLFTILYM